jgi:hypothetical protein
MNLRWLFVWTASLVSLSVAATPGSAAENRELLVCGWDEVYILDLNRGAQKVFSWKASDDQELPATYKDRFRTTDECKAVARNRILITASSDGVALVDRATGKAVFWGLCSNAHSAELLPGERIAVACSVREPGGNRLAVFDARTPEKELYSTDLYSGHGVLWDKKRGLLWALGMHDLRAYSLVAWSTESPSLKQEGSWKLPGEGGHELSPGDSRNRMLTVSAVGDVWLFDRERKTFVPHPVLSGIKDLKSASLHPQTGQWAYTIADRPEWWTSKIRFAKPESIVERTGERLYKVRWAAAVSVP